MILSPFREGRYTVILAAVLPAEATIPKKPCWQRSPGKRRRPVICESNAWTIGSARAGICGW